MRKFLLIFLALLALAAPAWAAESSGFRYARVATDKGSLNMRVSMKDNAEIVTKLQRGTMVHILADEGDWLLVEQGKHEGYVKAQFMEEIRELPYSFINEDSTGEEIIALKRALHKLGYLKSDEINQRFDMPLEKALLRVQLMNDVDLYPGVATPQLQALLEWDMIVKYKSGYHDLQRDEDTGLAVAVFCWDTGGMRYEKDSAVKLSLSYSAKAYGGVPPYDIAVAKSLTGRGPDSADRVYNGEFSHVWTPETETLYLYATVTDSVGNTVTACTPYRYTLPDK